MEEWAEITPLSDREKEIAGQSQKPAWTSILDRRSPRYDNWRAILQSDEVPLLLPYLATALLGDEKDNVYPLNLALLTPEQKGRLIDFCIQRFGKEPTEGQRAEIETELEEVGFPIREADVIVGFEARFF